MYETFRVDMPVRAREDDTADRQCVLATLNDRQSPARYNQLPNNAPCHRCSGRTLSDPVIGQTEFPAGMIGWIHADQGAAAKR